MDLHLSGEANDDSSSELTRVQFPVDSSFRDWTELLPDLLDIIVSKLYQCPDYLRFCGVCPRWRSIALQNANNGHRQWLDVFKVSRFKLPMLMIKTEENNNDRRGLYSVSDGITYNLKLPLPCRNRFIGSSHGWLLCVEEGEEVITLLNPLTNTCIPLPRFEDNSIYVHWRLNPQYYILKGILTENPHVSPDNYAVAVIYAGNCTLLIYKSGDMHWKSIDLHALYDVVCYKTDIYGYTANGKLVQIDVDTGRVKTIIDGMVRLPVVDYLVESQEDLLLVRRSWAVMRRKNKWNNNEDSETEGEDDTVDGYSSPITNDFKILKLVREKESANWVEIVDIGNQALFVGDNHSISISTVEFPGCRSNSIYFTNHYSQWMLSYTCFGPDEDSGFFNLDDKSVHPHHLLDLCELHMKPPIWFVPSFANSAA